MTDRRYAALAGALLTLLLAAALHSTSAPGADALEPATQAKPGKAQKPITPPDAKLTAPWPDAAKLAQRREEAEGRRLFAQAEPLVFTLAADFKAVNRERKIESTKTFPAVLSVKETAAGAAPVALKVTLGARGNIRRTSALCSSVPLSVRFDKASAGGTVFDGQSKLKLVTHCSENPAFDQYVLLEYLAYRLYNLLTPLSFRVRLARATYVDSKSGRILPTHNAVFIEDEDDLAHRFGGRAVEPLHLQFKDFDQASLTLMTLFQYMIGNPDYSIDIAHNVHMVQTPANVLYPITWDFDVTGLVSPKYDALDKRLGIDSVRKRSYLGPCRTVEEFEPTLAAFRAKRADAMALIESIPGLDAAERRKAADYLEEFFTLIAQKDRVKRELVDTCKDRPTT